MTYQLNNITKITVLTNFCITNSSWHGSNLLMWLWPTCEPFLYIIIGLNPRVLYQRGSLIALLTLKETILSIYHLVLEGEYVQACYLVSSMLSIPLYFYHTILIGSSLLEWKMKIWTWLSCLVWQLEEVAFFLLISKLASLSLY